MILKKKKSYFEEEQTEGTLEDFKVSRFKFGQNKQITIFFLRKMVQFNLKHWKTQTLFKGSTLN